MDIVIDLETLGTRPGCEVLEIGACAVDRLTGRIGPCLSRRMECPLTLDQVRAAASGRRRFIGVDSETAAWWLAEPGRAAVLERLLHGRWGITSDPLAEFAQWCEGLRERAGGSLAVWGNGPTFDLSILEHEYRRRALRAPWGHREERCVRTALDLAGYVRGGVAWAEAGPRHRALNDARHEARTLWLAGALGEVSAAARRLRERGAVKGGAA